MFYFSGKKVKQVHLFARKVKHPDKQSLKTEVFAELGGKFLRIKNSQKLIFALHGQISCFGENRRILRNSIGAYLLAIFELLLSRACQKSNFFRKCFESSRLSGVFIINISGLTTHPGPDGKRSGF